MANENKPLISVIVPIYKVELYLRKCIDSILHQTYTNLEIILVDDGSPDGCPTICDEYAAQDSRVRVIHKVNGGLSSARNAGLDIAAGEYIGFVDSDDWIAAAMYEKLYKALQNADADMAICSYTYVDEAGNPVPVESPIKNEVLSREEAFGKLFFKISPWFYVTAVNRLYKREIFSHIRFPVGRIHEDEFTVHHIFQACSRIVTVRESYYNYLQRSNSIMGAFSIKKAFDEWWAIVDRYIFFRDNKYEGYAALTGRKVYRILYNRLCTIPFYQNKEEFERNIGFYKELIPFDLRRIKFDLKLLQVKAIEKLRGEDKRT